MTTIANRLSPAQRSRLQPSRPRRRNPQRAVIDRNLEQARAALADFVADGWRLRSGRLSSAVVVAEKDTTKLYAANETELVALLKWRTGADRAWRAERKKTTNEGEQNV